MKIIFIFALFPTSFIDARRHRRRFGLKTTKNDVSNDVIIKTQFDQCAQSCQPNPKQFVNIIKNQLVTRGSHQSDPIGHKLKHIGVTHFACQIMR